MAARDVEGRARTARRRRASMARARSSTRTKTTHDFYGSALDAAERVELEEAAQLEGLDQEIALLRTRLRKALSDRPEDLPLMIRGMDLLVKAVSARYRLSKEAEQDLSEHLAGVIRGVGGLLMPEAFRDE